MRPNLILNWLNKNAHVIVILLLKCGTSQETGCKGTCTLDLDYFTQPDDVGKNMWYDTAPDDGILCSRNCTQYCQPRVCYWSFMVEQYSVMGPACQNCPQNQSACYNPQCIPADGFEKMVLTINRQIPAPAIQVCEGDQIIVDVFNMMPARTLAIHWHGTLQKKSPWMDGTPFVTQCPIPEMTKFRYNFIADTVGTHFYHSHEAFQQADGLYGAMVVRTSREADPQANLYDFDEYSHVFIISDWLHVMADDKYPNYFRTISLETYNPSSYLINGMGSFNGSGTPLSVFKVKQGYRYRWRIIGANSLPCAFKFSIQNHTMKLISLGGNNVKPVDVGSCLVNAGERIDVVVSTDQPKSTYWIYVEGQNTCYEATQRAILSYDNSDAEPHTSANETMNTPDFNDLMQNCDNSEKNVCTDHLETLEEHPPEILKQNADVKLTFHLYNYPYTTSELFFSNTYHKFYLPTKGRGGLNVDTLNNKSCIMPPFNMLKQDDPSLASMTCPEKCPKICECIHFYKFSLNDVIEIWYFDDTSTNSTHMAHPMHSHGYQFLILKQGFAVDRANPNLEQQNFVTRKNHTMADTVSIPPLGYAVIRLLVTNPGIWMFHCHYIYHNHNGMMFFFQAGERQDFGPIPKDFPECNDYTPSVPCSH